MFSLQGLPRGFQFLWQRGLRRPHMTGLAWVTIGDGGGGGGLIVNVCGKWGGSHEGFFFVSFLW